MLFVPALIMALVTTLGSLLGSSVSSYVGPPTHPGLPSATSTTGIPSRSQWLSDVSDVLRAAPDYVRHRADQADPAEKLALNLDIDNTAIASYFGGGPIDEVLRLTRLAHRHDVAILFNTARIDTHRGRTLAQLAAAGYRVDGLCMRRGGETRVHSKQRCRAQYADAGYTLIANLGNNDTDFAGSGYDKAYRLPNYGGLLP